MRAFVAIELPDGIRSALETLQASLRHSGARLSWVRTKNMHLTLRFLGDWPETALDDLIEKLEAACAGHAALRLALHGAGVFPNLRRPSVVWAGLEAVEGDLAGLQADIEAAVRAAGAAPDNKAFHPHITLARIRDPQRIEDLLERVQNAAGIGSDDFPVASVALFSSELRPAGPVYRRFREFRLSC